MAHDLRVQPREKKRFDHLVQSCTPAAAGSSPAEETAALKYCEGALALTNAIISSPAKLETRMKLRAEMVEAGLEDCLCALVAVIDREPEEGVEAVLFPRLLVDQLEIVRRHRKDHLTFGRALAHLSSLLFSHLATL